MPQGVAIAGAGSETFDEDAIVDGSRANCHRAPNWDRIQIPRLAPATEASAVAARGDGDGDAAATGEFPPAAAATGGGPLDPARGAGTRRDFSRTRNGPHHEIRHDFHHEIPLPGATVRCRTLADRAIQDDANAILAAVASWGA